MSEDLLTPDELKNELRKLAGTAYGQGMPAETIIDQLNSVTQRYENLDVIDKEFDQ